MSRALLALLLVVSFARPAEARRRAVRHPAPRTIQHVFVLVMENQDYDRVLRRPFLRSLAADGGLLANYDAIARPSQPNYIAMTAGSTWGVVDDAIVTLDVRHLGDLVEEHGLTWRAYAENYPGNCYLRSESDDGLYVRRHVPFLEFANVQKNKARCNANVVNATQLAADIASGSLPAVAFYYPNQQHNGHDTNLDVADAWMQSFLTPLLNDERFTRNTLLVVTYDEPAALNTLHITTVLWGAGVVRGSSTMHHYDHYSLLRTIEDLFHLGTLAGNDTAAEAIRGGVLQVNQ